MAPLQNLTDAQKLDIILDLLNESHRKQIALEKSIVALQMTINKHKIILTGYGAFIGSVVSAIIATFI
jgi:hypothetical protein